MERIEGRHRKSETVVVEKRFVGLLEEPRHVTDIGVTVDVRQLEEGQQQDAVTVLARRNHPVQAPPSFSRG